MKYVVSLGGSIINPGEIDARFLKQFVAMIKKRVKSGDRFFIVTGGGALARDYQKAAKRLGPVSADELDLLGIAATHINAELMRSLFETLSGKSVLVFGGTKPGWSTDYVAAQIAARHGVRSIINLSNIDYVYDKDPNKHKNARKLERLSWGDFASMFGREWKPGANLPFDPVAARLAKSKKMRVAVLNGKKLKNLDSFLAGKAFRGTVIE
jgi:uridylate kinase